MTTTTTLSPALRLAEKLLVDPPANPDVSNGYLDLLGDRSADAEQNTGAIEALWPRGSARFLRADAQRLPLKAESVDAVAEMVRVLPGAAVFGYLPNAGAHVFDDDELGDMFECLGLTSVRTKNVGTIQWVRGKKP